MVFCDVVGSTSLGEELDPESTRQLIARFFRRMQNELERHGGKVEKFIGDAVMAVFGVPRLHEDDALRAVRAADAMARALGELNVELRERFGTELQARIGVNTGEGTRSSSVMPSTSRRVWSGRRSRAGSSSDPRPTPSYVTTSSPRRPTRWS